MYTKILKVECPRSAVAGRKVQVQVLIRNLQKYPLHIAPTGTVNTTIPITFTEQYYPAEAGERHSFSGEFTMPDTQAEIEIDSSYWIDDQWRREEIQTKIVSPEGEKLKRLVISIDPDDAGEVRVSPSPIEGSMQDGYYQRGKTVRVTASPFAGNYQFTRWTGDLKETTRPFVLVNMNTNKTIAAHFGDLYSVALEVGINPLGGGLVTTEPTCEEDIDYWDNTVVGRFPSGTRVKIRAHPSEGYKFSHWSGDIDVGVNKILAYVERMTEPRQVTANFLEIEKVVEKYETLEVEVTPVGAGSVATKPAPSTGDRYITESAVATRLFKHGTRVTLTALPNLGYEFERWEIGAEIIFDPIYALDMIGGRTLKAYFREAEPHLSEPIEAQRKVSEEFISSPIASLNTCPYCENTFTTQAELNAHITDEHPGEPLVEPAPVKQEKKTNWKPLAISAGFLALAMVILTGSKEEKEKSQKELTNGIKEQLKDLGKKTEGKN